MKILNKILIYTFVGVLFFQTSILNVLAMDNTFHQSFQKLKKEAIAQNKLLDLEKYEKEMSRASSPEEQMKVAEKYRKYAIRRKIIYLDKNGNKVNLSKNSLLSYEPYETRLVEDEYVTAQTKYDEKSASTYEKAVELIIDVGMCFAKPIQGILYVLIGEIPVDEYSSYKNIVVRTLHDSLVEQVWVEVYAYDSSTGDYSWQTKAFTSKKSTSSQVNTVYYKDGKRQNPTNIDYGLVQTDTGEYFDKIDELRELAKTASHPISYPYSEGETKYFKEGEEVTP